MLPAGNKVFFWDVLLRTRRGLNQFPQRSFKFRRHDEALQRRFLKNRRAYSLQETVEVEVEVNVYTSID